MTIQELKQGDKASMVKTISESDVYLFAGITGDLNPAHVNQVSASQSPFGERIAHGILTAGLISSVLGMHLPGPGTIYLGQELRFTSPVYIGDTITATATISQILPEKTSSGSTPYVRTRKARWSFAELPLSCHPGLESCRRDKGISIFRI